MKIKKKILKIKKNKQEIQPNLWILNTKGTLKKKKKHETKSLIYM